jgi:hypothetical protein
MEDKTGRTDPLVTEAAAREYIEGWNGSIDGDWRNTPECKMYEYTRDAYEARIASLSAQVKAMREAGSAMRKELDYKASFDRMFNDKFPGTAELLVAAWDTATKSLDTPTRPNK